MEQQGQGQPEYAQAQVRKKKKLLDPLLMFVNILLRRKMVGLSVYVAQRLCNDQCDLLRDDG